MSFSEDYLEETGRIVGQLDPDAIERLATGLAEVRDAGGRLFVLGVGGSAAHAGHAVNDFRKLCGFETYAPTDNVSELTARVNDDGWDSAYVEWLRGSRLGAGDAVLALSVGGGSVEKNLSTNLVTALDHAREVDARIFAVVGRDGGESDILARAGVSALVGHARHTATPKTDRRSRLVVPRVVNRIERSVQCIGSFVSCSRSGCCWVSASEPCPARMLAAASSSPPRWPPFRLADSSSMASPAVARRGPSIRATCS